MKNPMTGLLSLCLLALLSCGGESQVNDGKVQVSGKVENAPEGVIVLSQFTDNRPKILDTLDVSANGEFKYELEVAEPTFYQLYFFGEKAVRLALLDEDVEVSIDFANPDQVTIEGSQDSKEMQKMEQLMVKYQEEVNQLNEAYYEAMSANNSEEIKAIQTKAMELEVKQAENVKEMISSMGDSFASLAAIGLLNPKTDFPFMDELVAKLNTNYPNTKSIMQLKQQLDELRPLSVGQPAPEIAMTNPNGELLKLSDYKGKYVMIDFWAAWCKPCREENPNVVRMYEIYKDKGFEILGVSLDRSREDWVGAIAADGLTWPQVSDLKYFNSEAAETYQINAIPATYLIDPDGNILAKDLRGPSLEKKLAELFD